MRFCILLAFGLLFSQVIHDLHGFSGPVIDPGNPFPDIGNRHSPTVICAAITSRMNKAKLPTHVEIDARKCEIVKDSVILLEQLRTIDKTRLRDRVCHLDESVLRRVDHALMVSLELPT